MTTKKFGDRTHWDREGGFNGNEFGWRPPGDAWTIAKSDPYWGQVIERAKKAYGDPNVHYNTDSVTRERFLVFGDGTRIPEDGSLAYRTNGKTYLQNDDGTFALQNADGSAGQGFPPAGWKYNKDDGSFHPVDNRGQQIGAGVDNPPPNPNGYEMHEGMYTPKNFHGDYYRDDPATGERKYFDAQGKPITKEQFDSGLKPGSAPGNPPPKDTKGQSGKGLQSAQVVIPDGMVPPVYPQWALDTDPDIPNQMTGVLASLFSMFGSGTPDVSGVPDFPFDPQKGDPKSGIDDYDARKQDFIRLADEFSTAAQTFNKAMKASAASAVAGRDAINSAIGTFNTAVKALPSGKWDKLLQAEIDAITSAQREVEKASSTAQNVGQNPDPGVVNQNMPGAPGGPGGQGGTPNIDDALNRLSSGTGMGNPLAPAGGNPLAAIPGMLGNGMGGGGNSGGGGIAPLAGAASDAIKPIGKIGGPEEKKKPVEPIKKEGITGQDPGLQPPPPVVNQGPAQVQGQQPAVVPAGNAATKPTVTLPDGKVVTAPNEQQAQAARNALEDKGGGGDAAQKAYAGTGVNIPSDGKDPGAKVDPGDMQAGDILKWKDKTMVAVGPGLVADPNNPGHVITVQEALKDPKGFVGVFRPTEIDPTLASHSGPPPLTTIPATDGSHAPSPQAHPAAPPASPPEQQQQHPAPAAPPAQPPSPPPAGPPQNPAPPPPPSPQPAAPPAQQDSIPLSGQGDPPPQPAPPSPFPSPRRSTKAERIAAGLE